MAGSILGAQGYQRSGKTMFMYRIAKAFHDTYNIPVYTNLLTYEKGWHFINSIAEIPFDFSLKIVLLDEIYAGADAQEWKKLFDITIFINTIGKQNIMFLFTTIDFNMVYNRIRNQMKYFILVKSDDHHIYYRIYNSQTQTYKDSSIEKNQQLFDSLNYDHEYVPMPFNWDMDLFMNKLEAYYQGVLKDKGIQYKLNRTKKK